MSKRQLNYDSDKELTAKRLREAMDEAGLTLTELAERSNVSKSSISQYTHAIQSPSNLSATSMSLALNVSPTWLMGFDVPKSREDYIRNKEKAQERVRNYAYLSNYAIPHQRLAKVYDALPKDGKKELLSYVEYLQVKYKLFEEEKKGESNER